MYSNSFVVFMGVGTVFFALAVLVLLTKVMSHFLGREQPAPSPTNVTPNAPAARTVAPEPNRQEVVAAIAAVLAEELGTDVAALRIHSIKRL